MKIEKNLDETLHDLETISGKELQRVALQRRYDTKFVCSVDRLPELLAQIEDAYAVLCDDGKRVARYETQYFDTGDLRCFHDHRRGRRSRYKVRIRSYPERRAAYLETKEKTNRGETQKFRLERSIAAPLAFTDDEALFIMEHTPLNPSALGPRLWTGFRRLTLVQKNALERVTVDLDLQFRWQGEGRALSDLAIVELKQRCYSRQSPIMRALRLLNIRPLRVSKYCAGNALFSAAGSLGFYKEKFKQMKRARHG